ncbi:hypothetical protein C1H46_026887 [Malus baccata]|uniref:Uncharacterized protein n=1 Tax=Malus baccata TaxID=106549 RepID=A0A540LME8_MALBA|nr:hypothetical protein C1H46_026887 [Malus baccata]
MAKIEVELQMQSQLEELDSAHAKQQASDATHEAEITQYIDLAFVDEVKANDYQESFEKVIDKLRLEM